MVFSPSNASLIVLRTTFGILPSTDYGTTWTWLCEDALGLPQTSNEDPNLGLTQTNALIAGLSLGLEVSPDTGCSWTTADGGLAGQLVKDIVVRPDTPDTVLAVTSTFHPDAGADGGQGYDQQIFSSTNDGTAWTVIGSIDPAATVTTIEVAKTNPQRMYVSAFRGEGPARTTSIFVSNDGGKTWVEHQTPFDPSSESAVYIAAVDPTNADLLYVRSSGASRLVVSTDGAQTFNVAYTMPQGDAMEGFALSEDGSKVFLGGPNTGLFVASSATLEFTNVSKIHVQCLATHGGDLWACSDEPSGFIAGVSHDDGATFTAKLHLGTIAGPTQCAPSTTSGAICTATDYDAQVPYNPFGSLCSNLGACLACPAEPLTTACSTAGQCAGEEAGCEAGSEGGSSGASSGGSGGGSGSSSGGGGSGSGKSSSCGCAVIGGGGAAGAVFGLGVGVALLALRRRRPR
jgi:MYXO-CTERM domain-containing protein